MWRASMKLAGSLKRKNSSQGKRKVKELYSIIIFRRSPDAAECRGKTANIDGPASATVTPTDSRKLSCRYEMDG